MHKSISLIIQLCMTFKILSGIRTSLTVNFVIERLCKQYSGDILFSYSTIDGTLSLPVHREMVWWLILSGLKQLVLPHW